MGRPADSTDPIDHASFVQSRALGDPTRHAVFTYIRDAADPVGVAQLTAHFGLNHNAIRQHLAKLREAGLVLQDRATPSGPGRPRLQYRLAPGAIEHWGSPSPYERLATMLTELLRDRGTPREVGREAGRHLATEHGTDAGAVELLDAVARQLGFEPRLERTSAGSDVILERCPFVGPATLAPDIVCDLHRGIAEGIAEAARGDSTIVDLVVCPPERAGCQIKVAVSR